MLYSYIYIYIFTRYVSTKKKHPEFPNRQSVFFQICPCLWCLTETLILTVILIEKIKLGSFALQQPCSCVKSHSPVLWDKNLHQWESKSSSGVRLLHTKIRNHKSQIKVPKGKKSLHRWKRKIKTGGPLLTIDFPTTTVSESPRWGLEWPKVTQRQGWGGDAGCGWEVKGGQPQVQKTKKVSLCNKTSLEVKQNEKLRNPWQASSPRLLVKLAVGDLSPV